MSISFCRIQSMCLGRQAASRWRPSDAMNSSKAGIRYRSSPALNELHQDTESQESLLQQKIIMKRFWRNVNIKENSNGFTIELDGKTLKTPEGHSLSIPLQKKSLAYMVAAEWEGQERKVRPHSFPLTSLVMRASDSFGMTALNSKSSLDSLSDQELETFEQNRDIVIDQTLKYLHTDATCYRQPYPESFVTLQNNHWNPLISWMNTKYHVNLKTTDSILGIRQSQDTMDSMRQRLERMSALELAAMEKSVLLTKSFVIGLALIDRQITVSQAADAARVEIIHQISKWGEVEDSHDTSREDLLRHLGASVCTLLH